MEEQAMNEYRIGKVAGIDLTVRFSAVVGSIGLWVVIAGAASVLVGIPLGEAMLGALGAVFFHWASEIVHQLGHAWAARSTGYPMSGVLLWGILGTSLYPTDEPPLPGAVHIRRALGGPPASLILTLLAGVVALVLRPLDQTPGWIAAFVFLENLLVYTLGAFVPLGFTDGSTLLKWRGKR
jgi:hypothetical protein